MSLFHIIFVHEKKKQDYIGDYNTIILNTVLGVC